MGYGEKGNSKLECICLTQHEQKTLELSVIFNNAHMPCNV